MKFSLMAENVARTVCSLFFDSDYMVLMSSQPNGSFHETYMNHPQLLLKALTRPPLHTVFRPSVHHPLIAELNLALRQVKNPETLFSKQQSDLRLHLRLNYHLTLPGACLSMLLVRPPIHHLTLTTTAIRLKNLPTLLKAVRATIGTKLRRRKQKSRLVRCMIPVRMRSVQASTRWPLSEAPNSPPSWSRLPRDATNLLTCHQSPAATLPCNLTLLCLVRHGIHSPTVNGSNLLLRTLLLMAFLYLIACPLPRLYFTKSICRPHL